MDLNNIRGGLEILIHYNSEIRHKLIGMKERIEYFFLKGEIRKRDEVISLCSELKRNIGELLRFLRLEEHIEKIIKSLDTGIYRTLKADINQLEIILQEILIFLERLIQTEEFLAQINLEQIKQFIESSEQILSRDVYTEKLMEEIIDFAKLEWGKNIKNKSEWLYHATSILFLPYIQKYGLDSSKLPRGIKRGIETLSKTFAKYGVSESQGGELDIDQDMSAKGISLAWTGDDIRRSASASNLPAFMHELFNEKHLRELNYTAEVINKLTPEDAKVFKTIMRFGRILRDKNKTILLKIEICSEFLTYLGIPDFISDYNHFFLGYFAKAMNFNELLRDVNGRRNSVSYLCKDIKTPFMRLYEWNSLGTRDLTGIRLKAKPIPPQFIYLEVQALAGYSPINILQWNENMTPRII